MATGVLGTNVPEFQTNFTLGEIEQVAQNIAALERLGGIFSLRDQRVKGNYVRKVIRRRPADTVSRRQSGTVTALTDIAAAASSDTAVKVKRTWGPVANTKDAWNEMLADSGGSIEALAQDYGRVAADDQRQDWLNTGIRAAVAALDAQAANKYTVPTSGALSTSAMIAAAALFGDAFMTRVVAILGHSKPFYDLIGDQVVTLKTTGISDLALVEGSPRTMMKPYIMTDSPALKITTGTGTAATSTYRTLFLVEGAVELYNARPLDVEIDTITGLGNLIVRIQGEYDFTVGVKGFQWDETNGGANPTDAAIATGTNWDKTATSFKDLAGVIIQST